MYCIQCGAQMARGARFCVECGAPAVGASTNRGDARNGGERMHRAESPLPPPRDVGQIARTWAEADRWPFRYDGAWWMRDTTGGAIRWNPAIGAWTPVPPGQMPFFMRRPPFKRSWSLAWWTFVLVAITSLLSIGVMIAALMDAAVISQALVDGRISFAESRDLVSSEDTRDTFFALMTTIFFASGILFIIWARRVTVNVPSLGVTSPRFGTGWATTGWFIPILNWWRPIQVLDQAIKAARATDRYTEVDASELGLEQGSASIYIWWPSYIACSIMNFIAVSLINGGTLEEIRGGDYALAVWSFVFACLGALACRVVYLITNEQSIADDWLLTTPSEPAGSAGGFPGTGGETGGGRSDPPRRKYNPPYWQPRHRGRSN